MCDSAGLRLLRGFMVGVKRHELPDMQWGRKSRRPTEPKTPTACAAFPAKAGIQTVDYRSSVTVWVPAFAGKTEGLEVHLPPSNVD